MTPIILRPDQATLKQDIYAEWSAGHSNVLGVLPTGGGKSIITTDIILDGHQNGLNEVVMAHRNELVGQMSLHVARRGIKHRIIGSKSTIAGIVQEHRAEFGGKSFVNPDARCSVGSVQTIVSRAAELKQWAAQVDRWTQDECFPAGTMISTPTGLRPIETMNTGDEVTAWDEKENRFVIGSVGRLYKNPSPKHMVRIAVGTHHVVCTPNHPFWTARGWVSAGDLKPEDCLYVDRSNVYRMRFSCDISVLRASETLSRNRSGVLQHVLLKYIPQENFIGNYVKNQSQICVGSNEAKQSDEIRRFTNKDAEHFIISKSQTYTAGWQRKGTTKSRKNVDSAVGTDRVCTSTCHQDENDEGYRLSPFLQAGYGSSLVENSCGSGWCFARRARASDTGYEKGHLFAMQRVDCIEIYKPTDFGTDRRSFVYNFEVDEYHTYIANGIVVHNCHHVIDQPEPNIWGKAIRLFTNAAGLGVTACPFRADGKGLGRHADGVFDAMCIGPTMRELINLNALSDYDIIIPQNDFAIDDDAITAKGDYSPNKMREASKRSHIVSDAVTEYLKWVHGKRAICFATDVETANDIANRFNEAGVPAASVSAKTDSGVRREMIRRFRDGRLRVLVNVDLFDEGFDVPACEVVIMARPTASLNKYLQMFGRALRVLAGKTHGTIIDLVSNWKRHGFPDKPHNWTLDRRDKKAKAAPDPDEIPLTACRECGRPYERVLTACPYCGAEPPVPQGGARTLQQVDGDLILLDREVAAQMRAAMQLEAPGDVAERVARAAGEIAGRGAANRQMERIQMQARLRDTIDQWAGIRMHGGDSERSVHKRFFLTTGMTTQQALALPRGDMEALDAQVRGWFG